MADQQRRRGAEVEHTTKEMQQYIGNVCRTVEYPLFLCPYNALAAEFHLIFFTRKQAKEIFKLGVYKKQAMQS